MKPAMCFIRDFLKACLGDGDGEFLCVEMQSQEFERFRGEHSFVGSEPEAEPLRQPLKVGE